MSEEEGSSSTFVRKDFYIDPPPAGASREEWDKWLEQDRKAAISAKREHTKSLAHEPGNMRLWAGAEVINVCGGDGVHRQATGFIGFQSNGDDTSSVVAAIPATQNRHFQARGTKGARQNQRKAAAGRARDAKRLRVLRGGR